MSIEDERVRFYLTHREDIERWAALRSEAGVAVDEWLTEREPRIRELADSLQAIVTPVLDGGYPRFDLRRSNWPACASITVEWVRAKTTLASSNAPYVGLRLPKEEAFRQQVRSNRMSASERKYTANPWWVGYRYCPPETDFIEGPEAYEAQLIAALREAWNDFAPLVDAALLPASDPTRA